MPVWLIFNLALGNRPPSHAELVAELRELVRVHQTPQYRDGIVSLRRPVQNVDRALCTQVNGTDEICTWPANGDFDFTSSPAGAHTTWTLAITEQIRRLRILNGT